MYEHWAKIVQSENNSVPFYVKCYKMYQSKVCIQQCWYIVSSLDIQLATWAIQELQSCMQKSGSWLLDTMRHILFPAKDRYKPIAQWLRSVALILETWDQFPQGVKVSAIVPPQAGPLAILCGTEPVSGLTPALLYCCALYNFFFLGFCQWRSCLDRVLTLKMNILLQFHCFGALGVLPGGQTRPHVLT